jgi:hypothetical protein
MVLGVFCPHCNVRPATRRRSACRESNGRIRINHGRYYHLFLMQDQLIGRTYVRRGLRPVPMSRATPRHALVCLQCWPLRTNCAHLGRAGGLLRTAQQVKRTLHEERYSHGFRQRYKPEGLTYPAHWLHKRGRPVCVSLRTHTRARHAARWRQAHAVSCSNCCVQRSAVVFCSLMLMPLPRPATCPLMPSLTAPRRQPLYRHRPLVLMATLPTRRARSYRRRSRRTRPPRVLRSLRVLRPP